MSEIRKWYLRRFQNLLQIILLILLNTSKASSNLELQIQPSTVITTKTMLTATAEVSASEASKYKFSFGSWKFETPQNKIVHRFSLPGIYTLKASAFINSTWSNWISKEILVFDHSAVMASQCTMKVIFFGLVESNSSDVVPQGSSLGSQLVISVSQCYGRCTVILNVTSNSKSEDTATNPTEWISFGAQENLVFKFNLTSKCVSMQARITFVTPTNTIVLDKDAKPSNASQCRDGGKDSQIKPIIIPDLRPNKIIAIFYVILLFLYIVDAFIAYRGQKQLLKPVQDLTDKTDEHMYEVRFHVGSGLSIKSTKCIIKFTIYGTHDVIGPLDLPATSFEDDGITSFLVSTLKEIGDVGTIGIFCKNMDLSSDWYLRKVDVFKHSEKPNGTLWSDNDVITRLAKFECHSWFSPASCTQSVSQVFHKNNERLRRSFIVDYASRCKQLFLQKHLVTSWTCSYGLQSFSKLQRLALLYSFWLVLTCLATLYLQHNTLQEEGHAVHLIHIGVIRLNYFTTIFAVVTATGTYFTAAFLSTVARLLHYQPKSSYTQDRNFRPLHIDIIQSRVVTDKQRPSKVYFAQTEQTNKQANANNNKVQNNNVINGQSHNMNGHVTMNGSHKENGRLGSQSVTSMGTNDVKSPVESFLSLNQPKETFVSIEPAMNTIPEGKQLENEGSSEFSSEFNHEPNPNEKVLTSDSIVVDIDSGSDFPSGKFSGDLDTMRGGNYTVKGQDNNAFEDEEPSREEVRDDTIGTLSTNPDAESNGFVYSNGEQALHTDEADGNAFSQNEKENDDFNNTVQFLNRETLPTMKENKFKVCFFVLLSNGFWILHYLLLAFSVLYSLINSASWTSDVAYHWISMSTLGMAVCCCLIDTIRVLIYVLAITIKERIKLKKIEKQTTFTKYAEYLLVSKRAESEKREFFSKEFPENKQMMVKNHYRLKGKVKDFLIFALFVVVLLILTQWTLNSKSFRFWRSLENFLFNFKQLSTIQSKGSVDPVVNFWKWMRLVLPPLLNITKRDITRQQFYIMGRSLNLIQKRVKKGQCQVNQKMKPLIDECNVDFEKKYEDRLSYSEAWKPSEAVKTLADPWNFRGGVMFHEIQQLSSSKSYALEGYIATFNATNIQENINELVKYKWIDQYTRMVYLEVFVYDVSSNFLSPVVIALEFTTSGYIFVTGSFFNFVLFPDFSPEHEFVQYAELIFFVMTFYFIFDIFNRKQRMSSTWFSGWLLTEALVIILSFVVITIVAMKNLCVYQLSQGGSLRSNLHAQNLHKIAFYQRILEHVLSVLNLFSIALMVKPLFTLGLFDDMYLAVVETLTNMKGIAIETIVIIFAFMFWARAAFVARVHSFSTFGTTYPTLMDMLVRPDNGDLYNEAIFGPFLLLMYYCIMILLISNIFISAVQQSYSKARRAFEDMQKGTVLKYFVKSFNKKASKRLLNQNLANKIGTFRRETNIKRLRSPTPSPKARRKAQVENNESTPCVSDALLEAVKRLETFTYAKVRKEYVEDRVLVTAISDGWRKVVEKKPSMAVISMYKKHLRR